jgi:S-DNA-T family DNA segregation ATPase FtsK/SpoIIIE
MKFFASKASGKGKGSGGSKKSAPPPPPAPSLSFSLDTWLDILGVACLGIAALTVFGLLSTSRSSMISGWLDVMNRLFGWGAYLAPLILALVGGYLLIRRFGDKFPKLKPSRLSGAVLAYVTALATLHGIAMLATQQPGADLATASQGGGELGWLVLNAMLALLGTVGAAFLLIALWAGAFLLMANVTTQQLIKRIQAQLAGIRLPARVSAPTSGPSKPTNDIIEPQYDKMRERARNAPEQSAPEDGELVINGLRPRKTNRQRPRDTEEELDAPRTVGVPVAPARPSTRASDTQKIPPARIIGASADVNSAGAPSAPKPNILTPRPIGQTAASPVPSASVAQPAAPPAPVVPQISSRLDVQRAWTLPKIEEVLEPGNDASMKEADIRQRANVIEETLKAFGVPGRVVEVNRGPTITQFGIEPGFNEMKGGKQVKVKVSRIAGLADDLALALAAPRIRIEAPVPGRGIVGIEVPNGETSLVSLRDVMESEEFERLDRKTRLRLGLGQTVNGSPLVADMTTMPHMLIAGTTGSGKSVCVNAIIVAMLCYNSPADVRFLMIDPKRVELTGYNGIPHLIAPVVVDIEKTTAVLNWVAREMDNRYRTFAKHSVRNIVDFNAKVASMGDKPNADPDLKKLPYIVLVIDELADLMMTAPDETEKIICRLAQMARATGIHLIIATQRPSVDVVTGLIKANFPARIAFTVATAVDSRVIIDGPGAEKLLGRGDMLVVTPEQSMPMRSQGCFLSDKEINRVVRHWRSQLDTMAGVAEGAHAVVTAPSLPYKQNVSAPIEANPVLPNNDLFSAPPTWDEARALDEAGKDVSGGNKDDKLFNDAVATVRLQGKASISLLQRRLRIGYTRAARLIEEMEERGIVGPQVPGQQHREVLNSSLND